MKTLVAFDFDYSLIDQDSDHFGLLYLAPSLLEKMEEWKRDMQWTDLMVWLVAASTILPPWIASFVWNIT